MSTNTEVDDRRTDLKIKMAEHYAAHEAEYRADNGNQSVVYEDDQVVVVSDHTGHELDEWASDFGVAREDLRQTMRALAEGVMGEQAAHAVFSHSDPVVFDVRE